MRGLLDLRRQSRTCNFSLSQNNIINRDSFQGLSLTILIQTTLIEFGLNFLTLQEAEKAAQAKQDRADARAAAAEEAREQAAAAALAEAGGDIVKSPSDFSCHSYESFVGAKGQDDNNKEKMSIHSEGIDSVSEQRRIPANPTKMRKVSAVSVLIFINILIEKIYTITSSD